MTRLTEEQRKMVSEQVLGISLSHVSSHRWTNRTRHHKTVGHWTRDTRHTDTHTARREVPKQMTSVRVWSH